MTETLAPGSRVGVYEIVDRLGAGGMGAVYRARDTRLGRTVALKVLRSGDDPELLRRLDKEAQAASALNHPNIVHIYDVGVAASETGAHYVAMEYVEGETLRRRLAAGPLPIPEVLDLGAQLTDGLAKAHRAGILHRDLKPENLIVTPDGLLKILDFGLAKVVRPPLGDVADGQTLTRHGTQAGVLLGTLEYMSPEQASGRPVDHRTDQFGAGLVIAEMATGRAVFRRDTPAQVLAAVIEREPLPLRSLRPDAPAALEALVSRCLEKDPERRFARTDELAAGLAALAGRSRGGSLASVGLASLGPPPLPTPPSPAPPAPPAPSLAAGPVARPPAISAEIVSASSTYSVQRGHRRRPGRAVERYDETELAELIRRGKLTGAELVRRDDEEQWRPLFESRVFRREVPTTGDPRDAARWRVVRALGGHFTGFFICGVVMYSTQGHLPFWMAIWGSVLALQAVRSAPALGALVRARSSERALPAGPPSPDGLAPRLLASSAAAPARAGGGPRAGADRAAPPAGREAARRRGGRDRQARGGADRPRGGPRGADDRGRAGGACAVARRRRAAGSTRRRSRRTGGSSSDSSTCCDGASRRSRRPSACASGCACGATWPSTSSSSSGSTSRAAPPCRSTSRSCPRGCSTSATRSTRRKRSRRSTRRPSSGPPDVCFAA